MGKQAVDDDANQTGQFLAALLDWPQATFASRLELVDGEITVDRETDHGIETIRLPLPAVVTVDLRLNEPRYASMAGIMKARKKPLEVLAADDLGVAIEPRVEVIRYRSAETRNRGERLNSVDELIERLTRPAPLCTIASKTAAFIGESMKVLVVAEHDGNALRAASLSCFTFARQVADATGGDVTWLVLGDHLDQVADQAAKLAPVLVLESPHLAQPLADSYRPGDCGCRATGAV